MKKFLSIALTILLIISVCPLGMFSITASADNTATIKTFVDKFTGFDTNFDEGDGTSRNPYIIKTANQFAAVACGKVGDTTGKYYKVADNVKAFDLSNTNSDVDFSKDMTAEQVQAALKDAAVTTAWSEGVFGGVFDGNGVEVYGLKFDNKDGCVSLFARAKDDVIVRNLTVRNCYFNGERAAVLFSHKSTSGKFTVQNCIFTGNCVFVNRTNDAIEAGGIISGMNLYDDIAEITNILSYDNIAKHATYDITYGFVGRLHGKTSATITNSIILDSVPHTIYHGSNAFHNSTYTNVYTNTIGSEWKNIDYRNNGATSVEYTYNYGKDGNATFNKTVYNGTTVDTSNSMSSPYNRTFGAGTLIYTDCDDCKGTALKDVLGDDWTYTDGEYPTPKIYISDVFYKLNGTVVTIAGKGEMENYDISPWGNDITEVIIKDGVTSIGDYAFSGCTKLTSITMPDSITRIGSNAFKDCTNLADVTIGNNVNRIGDYAFSNCTSITKLTIPDSVTNISNTAFKGCTNLTDVTIGNCVWSIGDSMFRDCTKLTNVVIGNNVTSIGNYAFKGCTSLTNITIPNSVGSIGGYAFSDCTNLTKVTIGNGVTSIGNYAFNGCLGIVKITLGKNIRNIGNSAFRGCSGIEKIAIPDTVRSIGEYAFAYCSGIEEIIIPENVTELKVQTFRYCTNLKSITIPKNIKFVRELAFYGCTGLEKVNITDIAAWCNIEFESVVDDSYLGYVGSNPLYYAKNLYLNGKLLTDLTVPDSISKINGGTFQNLTGLKRIYLPKGISIIYSSAFLNCDAVTDIYYEGTSDEWEDVVIQHSNGNLRNATVHYGCTGLPDEQEPEDTPIENIFGGASVTLTNSISVNFKVKKDQIDSLGLMEIYVKFTFGGTNYIVKNYTENGDYYVFTFDNIAPDRIGDDIQATLYAQKGGKTVNSETVQYSVATYCYNMLTQCAGDEYSLFRTLLVDLLNYGAKAQIYTGHKTGSLATAKLSETQKSWGTQTERDANSKKDLKYGVIATPTVNWAGGGLYLKNAVTLRFTITAKSIENLTVKVVCADQTYYIQSDSFVARSDVENGYYVYVDQIGAAQMSEAVYLTVYNGEDAVSNTICYSVESYVATMADSANTTFSDLLNAMLKYGDAAKAYVQGN